EFSEIALPDYQIENLKDQYDFVVANIIDGVLIKLKKELIEKTKVNGYLLLTGILEEREENFKREFLSDESIEIHTRVQQGEWVGYLVRRRDLA
ncbi:MAG: 50S ribosomal protein L11 methyltransferase, partial [Bdellovibrionota bacterium]|nr:50S ribosomal protein L11 methyltransferase [Bdellovibrionota bacterium]